MNSYIIKMTLKWKSQNGHSDIKNGYEKCFMCSNITKIALEELWIINLLSGTSYEALFEKSSLTSGLPNLLIMPISPPILELWKWFFDTMYAVIYELKDFEVRFEKA